MSVDVADREVEIDLSNLIGVNLTFAPLQLTLQGILTRLAALEADNAHKAAQIDELKDAVSRLREQPEAAAKDHGDGTAAAGCAGTDEHEAIWSEIDHLNQMLGELTDRAKERHTIEELYAARKRRDSHISRASVSQSVKGDSRPTSTPSVRPSSSAAVSVPGKAPFDSGRPSSAAGSGAPVASEDDGRIVADESESAAPLGDRVLSKAREHLPGFDETARFTAEEEEAAAAMMSDGGATDGEAPDGDSMQPSPVSPTPAAAAPTGSTPTQYEQRRARRSTRGSSMSPSHDATNAATAAFHARRLSSYASGGKPSATVSDRLQKDSEDIAYLNRVVAEILAEMRSLHDNVDLLQTVNDAGRAQDDGVVAGVTEDALSRLRELEKRVAQLQDELRREQGEGSDLREKLEELRRAVKPATRLSEDDVDNAKGLSTLQERVRALEDALNAAQRANERLEEKLQSIADATGGGDAVDGVSAAQFGLLKGTVGALEKQLAELQRSGAGSGDGKDHDEDIARLQEAVRRLQGETAALETATERAARDCARLEESKADKTDVLGAIADLRGALGRVDTKSGSGAGTAASEVRVNDLQAMLEDALERIARLDDDKADRAALQRLRDDLAALKRLMELNAQRDAAAAAAAAGTKDGMGGSAAGARVNDALLSELQQQLLALAESCGKDRDTISEETDGLRDLIDQLDRRKADAALVANKAERDYVENALERLMREVEQVLNATNAGLIDTLDKSLNILRDMIDGKANRHDIQRLQQQMAADSAGGSGGGAAADGLTGFKGYRCLGCNRAMETLRPRPTAPKMGTFLNRNPQNYPQDSVTRAIQQQSLLMGGTAHSEPLPPIEDHSR